MTYPKRLIEVDLPIKRISAHARREKSIRHGHISTLHIWWARRPLAACRAVICATLWPDPVDSLCPSAFRQTATERIQAFARQVMKSEKLARSCSPESFGRWNTLSRPDVHIDASNPDHLNNLRYLLLDFIADFANWDNSKQKEYLDTNRSLTQAAHEESRTKSELIREAFRQYKFNQQWELLRRWGEETALRLGIQSDKDVERVAGCTGCADSDL